MLVLILIVIAPLGFSGSVQRSHSIRKIDSGASKQHVPTQETLMEGTSALLRSTEPTKVSGSKAVSMLISRAEDLTNVNSPRLAIFDTEEALSQRHGSAQCASETRKPRCMFPSFAHLVKAFTFVLRSPLKNFRCALEPAPVSIYKIEDSASQRSSYAHNSAAGRMCFSSIEHLAQRCEARAPFTAPDAVDSPVSSST